MLTLTTNTGNKPCFACHSMPSVYIFTGCGEGVCQKCLDDACGYPGRFEAYGGHDEHVATAMLLDNMSMNGMEDDYMHNNGDYCGRFENYLLIQDSQGFITFEYYDTEEKAQQTYDRYFASGWGAIEEDIYVDYDNYPISIYVGEERKHYTVPPRADHKISENRIDAWLNIHMAKTGYFPNVWDDTGRGNLKLRKMKVVSWLT